ncbi:MAG: SxtJ family membrane protein [Bacteroidota bacterium]
MSALRAIAAEVRALDTSRRALRSFGLVVGGVFAGIAAVIVWRSGWTLTPWSTGFGSVGGTLALLGLAVPTVLRPVYRVWMGLAVVLGFAMTRVLLTLVFVLLVVPIGLALRLAGKDLLRLQLDREAKSYWLPRDPADPASERFRRYW